MNEKSSSRHAVDRPSNRSFEPRPADLLIVARDRRLLYNTFLQMSADEPDIEVRLDQRRRTGRPVSPEIDRRHRDISTALRTTGWVMIPGSVRTLARGTDAGT